MATYPNSGELKFNLSSLVEFEFKTNENKEAFETFYLWL